MEIIRSFALLDAAFIEHRVCNTVFVTACMLFYALLGAAFIDHRVCEFIVVTALVGWSVGW